MAMGDIRYWNVLTIDFEFLKGLSWFAESAEMLRVEGDGFGPILGRSPASLIIARRNQLPIWKS